MPTFPGPSGMGGDDISGLATLIFIIALGMFLYGLIRSAMQHEKNAAQKQITRAARVVGKRQESHVSGGANNFPVTSTTTYFITFEFDDGSREEFEVKRDIYGLLVDGDSGALKSQGTWFQGFARGERPAPQ
ncbi:MAG: DUF2500 domain-containing protein [Chloroflexota bacterium]